MFDESKIVDIDMDKSKDGSLFDPCIFEKLNTSNDETRRLNKNIRITAPEKKKIMIVSEKNVDNDENIDSKKKDVFGFFGVLMKNHSDKIQNSLNTLEDIYANNDRNVNRLNKKLIKVQNRLEKLRKYQRIKMKRKEKALIEEKKE